MLSLTFVQCALTGQQNVQANLGKTALITLERSRGNFLDIYSLSLDQFSNLFVLDHGVPAVYKFSPRGDSLRAVSGSGSDHYQFNGPKQVDARLSTAIFISDYGNDRIEQYTKDLNYTATLFERDDPDATKRFAFPQSIAVDNGGKLYVVDGSNRRVLKLRSDFSVEGPVGSFSGGSRPEGVLSNPRFVAVDGDERLVVFDQAAKSLVLFDNIGNMIARRPLPNELIALHTSNDTVIALAANGEELTRSSRSLFLYSTPDLIPIGRWDVSLPSEPNAAQDTAPLNPAVGDWTDFAIRNGAIYFADRHAIYRGVKIQAH